MRRLISAAGFLLAAGCGYVGEPLPPALNIPEKIEDLRGVQRGDRILVSFTPRLTSTEQLVLKRLREIDLRIGEIEKGKEFDLNRWAERARKIPAPSSKAETIEVEIPATEWRGKEMVIAVRAVGPTGRPSAWSNLLVMHAIEPLTPPPSLDAEPQPDGIQLRWDAGPPREGSSWRVWRAKGDGAEAALAGKTEQPSFKDAGVAFGERVTYAVQRVVQAGPLEAESEVSRAVTVTYDDVFAPAVPTGLTAIAGVNSVELSWERNPESDLKAYQVWRAEAGSEYERYGEPLAAPSLSDKKVESGKTYRYAVSAIDEKGNESKPCAPVEIVAP
jgi:hypothetical protein